MNGALAAINAKLGTNVQKFTINSMTVQIVAGKNYNFHLTDENGNKYTVALYWPLPHTGDPTEVTSAVAGHVWLKKMWLDD